jgi:hypothetical protein
MFVLLRNCLIVLSSLTLATGVRAGVILSFGGYSWDQDDVPNQGTQLGVNDATSRSGASFGPANDTNLTRTGSITGFVEGTAGVNTGVGYLSRITQRKASEAPAKLETTGTRAVNIPQSNLVSSGNIGTAIIRRGIQVGWTAGTKGFAVPVMVNSPGIDLVIWESGDANEPDGMIVRVRNAVTTTFTDWFYYTPTQSPVTSSVLFGFAYDLSNFGLSNGAQIDLIEIANIVSTDRIDASGTSTANGWVAQGRVKPEFGGEFGATNPGPDPGNISPAYGTPFGNSTYDPDPLYVSVLGNLQNLTVPEANSLAIWSLVVGISALRRPYGGR